MKSLSILLISSLLLLGYGCNLGEPINQSTSGAVKVNVNIPKGLNGHTVEQDHVSDRYIQDNTPGSIKYLYVISAYSGQVLIYSTVKAKVTSSGKRLSPSNANFYHNGNASYNGFPIDLGNGLTAYTDEVLGDDGTYGTSGDYIYWWDTKGIYHQQYNSAGIVLHISSQPLAVKSIILNMETDTK